MRLTSKFSSETMEARGQWNNNIQCVQKQKQKTINPESYMQQSYILKMKVKTLKDKLKVEKLLFTASSSRNTKESFSLSSKSAKTSQFLLPLLGPPLLPHFSIIFLVYHLNPCCCSPFLITSVERKQFRIGELFLRKPDLCKVQ